MMVGTAPQVHQNGHGPSIRITNLRFEHAPTGFGIGSATPRLTWRFAGPARDWVQERVDIRVTRRDGEVENYHRATSNSVLEAWPSAPLTSGESARVAVKATGKDGSSTSWYESTVEATLLKPSDWVGKMVSCEPQALGSAKRPFYLQTTFQLPDAPSTARLYATAQGLYEIDINGKRVGDQVLKPGWTSYAHRTYFQTFDVTSFLQAGENTIRGLVAEGWYSGQVSFFPNNRNVWGSRNALLAQLHVDGDVILKTDENWSWSYGGMISSGIYAGETYDYREDEALGRKESWKPVEVVEQTTQALIADMAPIRRIQSVKPQEMITTPSGKTILDFGQNLVGWVRIEGGMSGFAEGDRLTMSHAEVLEHKELGTRPLRGAKATDTVIFGRDKVVSYEPSFTFHGFRYLQVDGWKGDSPLTDHVTAVVVHTDMERLGYFSCSEPLVNQLHSNVVWGMRGNFVGLPTDCPQRDERLGWTGDIQAFCRTANYLYDTHDILSGWLQDLSAEQFEEGGNGHPPLVVPHATKPTPIPTGAVAIWGDVAVLAPGDLHDAFGDAELLRRQWESMYVWLTEGIVRGKNGLWLATHLGNHQLGDWLDPKAPPDAPGDGQTDPDLVANCFLLHVTRRMGEIATVLGKDADAKRFKDEFATLLPVFQNEYITPNGRLVSDSQTAFTLALHFGLLRKDQIPVAIDRFDALVRMNGFKVGTGFAGTPLLLDALAEHDRMYLAYRVLLEKKCPSMLYPVTMGATTVWERWDSMRPDGTINSGEMTSFNHYALGAVAAFMHEKIGGLSPLSPGWKKILVKPQPGGNLTSASTEHISPYGRVACSWKLEGDEVAVEVEIPPNTSAQIDLGSVQKEVGSGKHQFTLPYIRDERWPPRAITDPMAPPNKDEFIDGPLKPEDMPNGNALNWFATEHDTPYV